jgi:hypothetical protein
MAISGEFYLVQIGSVYLTDDGSGSGNACLTKVDGLSKLFLDHEGATNIPLSGKPWNNTREISGNNVQLVSKPFAVKEAQLEDIKDLIDAADGAHSAITVIVSNGPGSVSVDCDPFWDESGTPPLNFGGNFFDDDLFDVEVRFITRGFTPPGP